MVGFSVQAMQWKNTFGRTWVASGPPKAPARSGVW